MNQYLTSKIDPMLGASGSMANPGTKNIGSPFAKRSEPGKRLLKIESPSPGLTIWANNMKINRMQHPPS